MPIYVSTMTSEALGLIFFLLFASRNVKRNQEKPIIQECKAVKNTSNKSACTVTNVCLNIRWSPVHRCPSPGFPTGDICLAEAALLAVPTRMSAHNGCISWKLRLGDWQRKREKIGSVAAGFGCGHLPVISVYTMVHDGEAQTWF